MCEQGWFGYGGNCYLLYTDDVVLNIELKCNMFWFKMVLCVNRDGLDMAGITICCIQMMY